MKMYKTKVMNGSNSLIVQHHNTTIIYHDYETNVIHLNNGGWYSKTTKERINSYIKDFGYKLYQKNYQWFIEYPHGEKVEYFNHMTLEPISEKLKAVLEDMRA